MDVRPVGGGTAGADLARAAAPAPPTARAEAAGNAGMIAPAAAIDAAFIDALSQPDLARLLAVLEHPQTPETAVQLGELLQTAVRAAAEGDALKALNQITQLVRLDPLRAEALRAQPGLEPVRAQIDSLLTRLAQVSRLDAEGRIAQAAHQVEGRPSQTMVDWDAPPETLLLLANRLLDAGGHANFVRAAEVAQVVIDGTRWAPVELPLSSESARPLSKEAARTIAAAATPLSQRNPAFLSRQAPARLRILWRRAPLLVLLLGWFGVGLAGGAASWLGQRLFPETWPETLSVAAFDVWAVGFLALVLFGFYMRVRNVRMPR